MLRWQDITGSTNPNSFLGCFPGTFPSNGAVHTACILVHVLYPWIPVDLSSETVDKISEVEVWNLEFDWSCWLCLRVIISFVERYTGMSVKPPQWKEEVNVSAS